MDLKDKIKNLCQEAVNSEFHEACCVLTSEDAREILRIDDNVREEISQYLKTMNCSMATIAEGTLGPKLVIKHIC